MSNRDIIFCCRISSWDYCVDLFYYYYLMLFEHPLTTDSIEAGPFKITLSNATDWSTIFKMLVTILGTYAGFKLINKIIK